MLITKDYASRNSELFETLDSVQWRPEGVLKKHLDGAFAEYVKSDNVNVEEAVNAYSWIQEVFDTLEKHKKLIDDYAQYYINLEDQVLKREGKFIYLP